MPRGKSVLPLAVASTLLLSLLFYVPCRGEEVGNEASPEIMASLVKAYGGAEAVRKVVSVTAKGTITEFLNGKSGGYARYFQRARKLRIEVMPDQGGEVRILNGNRGWQSSTEGFVPASALELQSMLYQYSYLNLPMALADGTYHAKYGGKQTYKGQPTYLLFVELKNAPRLGILLDAKSGLILRVDASFAVGTSATGELSTQLGEYRPVKGVLFPHKLTSYAGGIKIAEIALDDIAVNQPIPPELFRPKEEELRKAPPPPASPTAPER